MKKAIVAAALATTAATLALAQGLPGNATPIALPASSTPFGQSARVDWTKGMLIAEGIGIATTGSDAQKEVRGLAAARADAQRILVSALQGVAVTSATNVKNFALLDDTITVRVEGALLNAVPIMGSEKLDRKADGSLIARISYAVPLYGEASVLAAVLPTLTQRAISNPPQVAQPTVKPSSAPPPAGTVKSPTATPTPSEPTPPQAPTPTTPPVAVTPPPAPSAPVTPPSGSDQLPTYTGLIVDARGKNYVPCLDPKILIPNGKEVWGTIKTTSAFANDYGIASFVRRIEDATRLRDRGGPGQLTVKAVKSSGKGGYNCDAVISEPDAALVQRAEQLYGFLKAFRVTFIY